MRKLGCVNLFRVWIIYSFPQLISYSYTSSTTQFGVELHYWHTNPTRRVGPEQSGPHHHIIEN